MNNFWKYIFLFHFGGSTYITLELIYRNHTHISMYILAGIVFILIGLLNELWEWTDGLIWQIVLGTAVATLGEFITGCIVNLWLGLNVWDYSHLPGNILGQICPQFTALWIVVSLIAIVLDDVIRWKFMGEDRPIYFIGNKCIKI